MTSRTFTHYVEIREACWILYPAESDNAEPIEDFDFIANAPARSGWRATMSWA